MADGTTRHTILSEARDLFMTKGFANTSIREVCERAAVTPPVIYYHFGSKEALFLAVVAETLSLDDFSSQLSEETAACADPREKLGVFVRTYLASFPTQMLNPGLYFGSSTKVSDASLRLLGPGLGAIYDLLREILRTGIAAGECRDLDVDTTAACLLGSVDSFVRAQVYLGAVYDPEELTESILNLFERALASTPAETSK